ncbi:uncharacterized protein LOC117901270 [Drosophila subobscura]|uniref:uncharacterized protein LOC117901270 n=1 Tax=Drosophila subobscura TaxID=7241 RepID=UPI00155A3BF3|nr:uncharacterized protein LOC117901270 [Drosophila subobscura]
MLQWVRLLRPQGITMQIAGQAKETCFALRLMSKGKGPPARNPPTICTKRPTEKSPHQAKSAPSKSPTAKSPTKGPPAKSSPIKSPPLTKQKDETAIRGGSKCRPKNKCKSPTTDKPAPGAVKKSCDDLLNKRSGKKIQSLTEIQGGGSCAPKRTPDPPHSVGMERWRSISLYAILPMVAILTLLVLSSHKEHEHPEFKYYPHMYKRTKPYWFKDGNRTAFHNSHQNALPPAGYEDEIDELGVGQGSETEKDKKQRLSDFEKLLKDWKKHVEAH